MIVDKIENLKLCFNIHSYFEKTFNYIETVDFNKLKEGVFEIEGTDFFTIYSDIADAKNEAKFESHKKYLDIHYVIKGTELFGFKNIDHSCVISTYSSERDVMFFENKEFDTITLSENMFVVFFPSDVHAPVIESKGLKKIVFKIKI